LEYAQSKNVPEVFLITDSAEKYFEKRGFMQVDRKNTPEGIAQTKQFSALYPLSAIVMKIDLT